MSHLRKKTQRGAKLPTRAQPHVSVLSGRSPERLVPLYGLILLALVLVVYILYFAATLGTVPEFAIIWLPFIAVYLIAAFGVRRASRFGYPLAIVISAVSLALFGDGGHGVEIYATPVSTLEFLLVITFLPVGLAVLLYSVQGLRMRKKAAKAGLSAQTMARSSIAILVIIGFIVGGLVVGLASGAVQARLIASSGTQADVTIVQGAALQNNAQFYTPATFTIMAGTTVTWVNRDSNAHTITATNGAFDSGNLDSGAIFQHTFTQPGTYNYSCTYHSWMKGTIVVTSG